MASGMFPTAVAGDPDEVEPTMGAWPSTIHVTFDRDHRGGDFAS